MKTLPLYFIAALAAFFSLPVDFTTTLSVLFAAGLGSILVADYRSRVRPLRLITAGISVAQAKQPLRLAA